MALLPVLFDGEQPDGHEYPSSGSAFSCVGRRVPSGEAVHSLVLFTDTGGSKPQPPDRTQLNRWFRWSSSCRGSCGSVVPPSCGTCPHGHLFRVGARLADAAVQRCSETLDDRAECALKIKLDVTPAIGSEGYRPHLPTLKLHFSAWGLSGITTCIGAAMHRVWPLNPDPTFATGVVAIARELNAPASTLRRTAEFLEPLFAPQTRFSEMAQLLVAVSLLAKDSGLKGYAVDALIALIEDGRCVGDELGGVFRRLLLSDAVKCNRLAEQLGEVVRVSPLHAHVCSRIVQTMFNDVASLPNGLLPNDAHHLLAPLNEWLVELNEPLREATRGVLATVTGSSKTAKLAKGLLARTSPADPVQWRQIVLASLRGRLPRAMLCQPLRITAVGQANEKQ